MASLSSHRKDKATLLMTLITVITTGNSVTRATDIVKRTSACSDLKEHTLQNLDRQKVECGAGEAIVSFHLTADGCDGNDMRYEYDCLSIESLDLESVVERETGCTQMRGETLEYLDRQFGLGCSFSATARELLLSFQLTGERCNGNDMNYVYSCAVLGSGTELVPGMAESTILRLASPSMRQTACTPFSGQRVMYLDRQAPTCDNGEVMVSFAVNSNGCSSGNMHYTFYCSKLHLLGIRLVDSLGAALGSSVSSGLLQISGARNGVYNGETNSWPSQWYYVCDHEHSYGFDYRGNIADMACKELGYAYGSHSDGVSPTERFVDDVNCVGTEASLVFCQHSSYHTCQTDQAVTLSCFSAHTPSPSSSSNISPSPSSSSSPSSSQSPSPSPYCPDGQVEDDFAKCCSSSFLGMGSYGKFKCCGLEVQEEDGGACPACDKWAPLGEKPDSRKFAKCTRCQNQLGVDCSQNDRATSRAERKCTTKKKKCIKWGYINE